MKVGDLIRCTKKDDEHQGRIGLIMEVEWHDFGEGHLPRRGESAGLPRRVKDGCWVHFVGNCDWDYHWEEDFEVISEAG